MDLFKNQLKWLFICSIIFSCKTKQWNLNKTVGWEQNNDFVILLLKWENRTLEKDSMYMIRKKTIETNVLNTLRSHKLGELAESDPEDANTLFIVPHHYKQALNLIIETINNQNIDDKIDVLTRDYSKVPIIEDKIVYSMGK